MCVVVAVGVCRAFIGLILVIQSVGRIFTVALQSCCSLVAVLSQVCYCRVTVTHRVTGVLLSITVPHRVTVVLSSCYHCVTVPLRYRCVTVALLSRYCRVTVALLSCYCRVTVALLSRYYRVIVAFLSCYLRVIVVLLLWLLLFRCVSARLVVSVMCQALCRPGRFCSCSSVHCVHVSSVLWH